MADDWTNMSAAFSYDAYGNVTASEGRVDTPLKYRGEQQDNDTGYVYLRARYYDPQTAQFTTLDPLVGQTRSPYGYANNSPLNFADPSGEMPLVVGIWLVAEVGLAAADGLSMLATLSDPCATRGAKLAGVGFFVMGALGPGGGYGTAAKGVKQAGKKAPFTPSFVGEVSGPPTIVPKGAQGPVPAKNGHGMQYINGSGGGFNLHSTITAVRIMDPRVTGRYPYPKGYVAYHNAQQEVHPFTGLPVPRDHPLRHIRRG